jgi:hypothetical protein
MGRSKCPKITRSPIVEAKFVLVHTSRKTYRRMISVRRANAQLASPVTPTAQLRKKRRADPTEDNSLGGGGMDHSQPEVEPFAPFGADPLQPVVPNVSTLLSTCQHTYIMDYRATMTTCCSGHPGLTLILTQSMRKMLQSVTPCAANVARLMRYGDADRVSHRHSFVRTVAEPSTKSARFTELKCGLVLALSHLGCGKWGLVYTVGMAATLALNFLQRHTALQVQQSSKRMLSRLGLT